MEQAQIPGLEAGLGGQEGLGIRQDFDSLLELFDQAFYIS